MSHSALAPLDINQIDLQRLNHLFHKADPRRILTWCLTNIPQGLVQVSTFNIDELVITDLLYRELKVTPPLPVLFIDTLHHFPETLALVTQAKDIYNLDLRIYKVTGVKSRKAFARKYGEQLWHKDLAKFQQITYQQPLQRGLNALNALAWISCYRQMSQVDPETETAKVFELDPQGRLKINPLAFWTRTESWAYSYEHDLIYNPLHDQGYGVISDEPLTELSNTLS